MNEISDDFREFRRLRHDAEVAGSLEDTGLGAVDESAEPPRVRDRDHAVERFLAGEDEGWNA